MLESCIRRREGQERDKKGEGDERVKIGRGEKRKGDGVAGRKNASKGRERHSALCISLAERSD